MLSRRTFAIIVPLLLALVLTGCRARARQQEHATQTAEALVPPTETATPAPSPTSRPTNTPSPTATPTPRPYIVGIDPGHGGEDLGACHVDTEGRLVLTESEANLSIALYLRDELAARGIEVVLIRDGDYALNEEGKDINVDGTVDYVDELQARLDMINDADADLLLSIHQNAFYYGNALARDVGGTVTYYCDARPFYEESLRFAHLAQEAIVSALAEIGYESSDRGVRLDSELNAPGEPVKHLIVLGPATPRLERPSEMPGVLSETLFITDDQELQLLLDDDVRQRLAVAYADAIEAYFAGREQLTP